MNDQYVVRLVHKYRKKGLLIDTNLALLYVVGSLNTLKIKEHKRTCNYTIDDFDRVVRFAGLFDKVIVTPHILTEMSNLLGKSSELQNILSGFIRSSIEIFKPSISATRTSRFASMGLTDSAILSIAKNKFLVLTDDMPLAAILVNASVETVVLESLRRI
ncbi:MAG: hypothetical protein K1X52_05680 [Pyrinomonadaceae bacterium]|nr:hypothetical protein [Pyrinomonadaceae bacterium]